ncbi:hypothetical protein ACFOW1_09530 [Parasediminibacterium paludis]|uniref:Uncharacterized protein n=1 Tax=Parasediminibacterium paludis TaxID=908966 RepID=A0ABV8PXI9_9BACT
MKKFLNRIVAFFKSIFDNFDAFVATHVVPSIELTKRLIAILESPIANIITALIPGEADDKLKEFLLTFLHKAIDAMNIAADITNEPNWTLKVYKTIKYIESLSPEMRQDVLRGIARNLVKQSVLANGDSMPKDSIINGLIETKLIQLRTSLEVLDKLPNETIVNGELQPTPVAEAPVPVVETPVVPTIPVAETPVVPTIPVAETPVVPPVPVVETPVVSTIPVVETPVVSTIPVAETPVVPPVPVVETPVVQ